LEAYGVGWGAKGRPGGRPSRGLSMFEQLEPRLLLSTGVSGTQPLVVHLEVLSPDNPPLLLTYMNRPIRLTFLNLRISGLGLDLASSMCAVAGRQSDTKTGGDTCEPALRTILKKSDGQPGRTLLWQRAEPSRPIWRHRHILRASLVRLNTGGRGLNGSATLLPDEAANQSQRVRRQIASPAHKRYCRDPGPPVGPPDSPVLSAPAVVVFNQKRAESWRGRTRPGTGALRPLNLPGLRLVDPDTSTWQGQSSTSTSPRAERHLPWPVTVGPFDVPAFQAPVGIEGKEGQIIQGVASFSIPSLTLASFFTSIQPDVGQAYSTIYVTETIPSLWDTVVLGLPNEWMWQTGTARIRLWSSLVALRPPDPSEYVRRPCRRRRARSRASDGHGTAGGTLDCAAGLPHVGRGGGYTPR